MFFYVDESGNTGANLFDKAQPCLYYGILSADTNIDDLAHADIQHMRERVGVKRLHASELGVGGLVRISDQLITLQQQYQLRFDLCKVVKTDHAIISFFDQVFDQGMNPAITWSGYWTPMRYILLLKLATLFDIDLARQAWEARIDTNTALAQTKLMCVCNALLERVSHLPDVRSRQLIGDAVTWAVKNPSALQYNCTLKSQVLDITPNIIGFQSVMEIIASMLETPTSAKSIIVDRQVQFNKAQTSLAKTYHQLRNIDPYVGPGMPEIDLSTMPEVPITCKAGDSSLGLEIVDCYLWIFKRFFEEKSLAPELEALIGAQRDLGSYMEISLDGIHERWETFFADLPEPTAEQIEEAKRAMKIEEERRVKPHE